MSKYYRNFEFAKMECQKCDSLINEICPTSKKTNKIFNKLR